jgi:hypothetical protein
MWEICTLKAASTNSCFNYMCQRNSKSVNKHFNVERRPRVSTECCISFGTPRRILSERDIR